MKRLALAGVLLCLGSFVGAADAVDEPTTSIAFSFGARQVPGREAEAKAAWELFCQTVHAADGQWKSQKSGVLGRGEWGGGSCTLRLTNAQFSVMLDALRVLMANAAFSQTVVDIRITS